MAGAEERMRQELHRLNVEINSVLNEMRRERVCPSGTHCKTCDMISEVAMSADAGSIVTDSPTARRIAYGALSSQHKDEIVQAVGQVLSQYYRAGPAGFKGGTQAAIAAVLAAVLDQ